MQNQQNNFQKNQPTNNSNTTSPLQQHLEDLNQKKSFTPNEIKMVCFEIFSTKGSTSDRKMFKIVHDPR
jgi:hypothetical protein